MSEISIQRGFDPAMAGRWAECDGGGLVNARFAVREDFAGTLTGEYIDHGDPPWRWYRMTALTVKPDGYSGDIVWCESGNLWVTESPPIRSGGV